MADDFLKIGFDFSKVDIRSFNAGFIGFFNNFDVNTLIPIADAMRKHDQSV